MFIASQENRRLVPQWRQFKAAVQTGELAMPARPKDAIMYRALEPDLVKRLEAFRERPTLISAADVVESAVVLGHDSEGVQAARVLLRDGEAAPLVKIQAARLMRRTGNDEEFEGNNHPVPLSKEIVWRERLRLNPADAIAWVELAFVQFCRGHAHHAKRSMTIALHFAPSNRHVLRSAARLFFQIREFGRAYDLVRKSESIRSDPWLMAAEIALSGFAGKRPTFMKHGQSLLESENFAPAQTTELSGALGTQLLFDGTGRHGRKFMRQSQVAPTVNALAQAEWVSVNMGTDILVSQPGMVTTRKAWEAMAMHAFSVEGDLKKSFDSAIRWIADEPYNASAYASAAVAANVMEEFDEALKISRRGLALVHRSEALFNTIAFALACTGDLHSAEVVGSKIPNVEGDVQSLVSSANRGLIALRRGQIERGKALYNEAISGFRRGGHKEMEASANLYFASELVRSGELQEVSSRLETAIAINKNIKRKYIEIIAARVGNQLKIAARDDAVRGAFNEFVGGTPDSSPKGKLTQST
jgi:hypothetical protein